MLKFRKLIRIAAPPSVLWLGLLACSTAAVGQQGSAIKDARGRRVSQRAEENAPTASESAPEPSIPQPNDQNRVLRDQIAAAKTPEEQTRLRMELVDQLVAAGMKSEANSELRAMVAADRFDPTTFYNLGNRLVRLGNIEAAVVAYRKAIAQRNGSYSRALNNLGAALLQLGRWDEAYDALSSALRLENFHYAEASFNLGRLYAVRGETDLAIREWRRALAANPQHSGAARELANARSDGKIRVSPNTKPPPATATPRSVNGAPAVKATAKTLLVDQSTFDLLQKGRVARERGHDSEAVGYYRGVLSHMGGYFAPANLELSYALINLKRTDEAIALLIPVSTNDGARYPICYYYLARLYETQGHLKLAEENYSRAATAYSSDYSQFILDLSRVREKLGDLSAALATLEQYVHAAEKAGHKPDWSDERLAELRKKIAASPAVPGRP